MNELENAWKRIAAWYAQRDLGRLLGNPTPEHHIQKLESLTGFRLPENMKQSFRICSGLADSPVQELLCPKRIYDEWIIWHENVIGGGLPYDDAELSQNGWNVSAWMPLTWDGGSNGFYINLDSEDSAFATVFYLPRIGVDRGGQKSARERAHEPSRSNFLATSSRSDPPHPVDSPAHPSEIAAPTRENVRR